MQTPYNRWIVERTNWVLPLADDGLDGQPTGSWRKRWNDKMKTTSTRKQAASTQRWPNELHRSRLLWVVAFCLPEFSFIHSLCAVPFFAGRHTVTRSLVSSSRVQSKHSARASTTCCCCVTNWNAAIVLSRALQWRSECYCWMCWRWGPSAESSSSSTGSGGLAQLPRNLPLNNWRQTNAEQEGKWKCCNQRGKKWKKEKLTSASMALGHVEIKVKVTRLGRN